MSIRDELAQIVDDVAEQATREGRITSPLEVVDAILARFAVVELPEPHGQKEAGQPFWDSSHYTEVEDGEVYLICGTGYMAPGEARELATVLLAAAKRAEAQS